MEAVVGGGENGGLSARQELGDIASNLGRNAQPNARKRRGGRYRSDSSQAGTEGDSWSPILLVSVDGVGVGSVALGRWK
jgi:hypothetical protein